MPLRRNVKKYAPKRNAPARKQPKKYTKKPMRMSRTLTTVPFPKIRQCTFIYKQPSVNIPSSLINGKILIRLNANGMFDFDADNYLADKQPLFYDQMFSAVGPYRYYKVNAWKTKLTVTNLTNNALQVYYDQGTIGSIVEADTAVEAQNRPGVIYNLLTGAANAKPQCTIKSYKTTRSFAPRVVSSGLDYGASYNANPLNTITSTLLVTNLDATDFTQFNCVVTVEHVFFATCYLQDSTLS